MSCSGQGLIGLDQALASLILRLNRERFQTLPLVEAHQHYLAQDVLSEIAITSIYSECSRWIMP